MVSVFHMLTRNEPYRELGANYFDERRRHYTVDRLTSRIEHLGYRVHLEPEPTAYSGDSCHPIRCKAATSSEGSLPRNPDESCTPSVLPRSAATPELIGLGCGLVVFHASVPFAHRIPSEAKLVRVMEQPVKDSIS